MKGHELLKWQELLASHWRNRVARRSFDPRAYRLDRKYMLDRIADARRRGL